MSRSDRSAAPSGGAVTLPPMSKTETTLRDRVRYWVDPYVSVQSTPAAWTMLALDVLMIGFFMLTTFLPRSPSLMYADYALGGLLAVEWGLRLWASRDRLAFTTRPLVLVDLVVVMSLLAPSLTENFAFLRVLRAMRLLRSYHVLTVLRAQSRFFRQHELVIFSATHLLVFVFVVSAAVYALQARVNDQINNYVDALYFTVTTLTTTGFGDIVMVGPTGRVLSVLIMIVGVSLFLRLIQAIFRPPHVDHECPDCGLTRHDIDAVHCKHCGRLLHIRTQGADE